MKIDVIYTGDCQEGIPKRLPDESVDFMPTDPPYGIGFMNREWDKFNRGKQTKSQVVSWMRTTMKKDTRGMMEFFTSIWKECFRVLKPGAFAFVMCIPRQDCLARQVISLEDAGFNVSFSPIFHAFASGFPKAQNISKAVDKRLGAKREIICKQKDISINGAKRNPSQHQTITEIAARISHEYGYKQKAWDTDITNASSPQAQALDGSYAGFQPKPAVEVILVAMKPLSEKTYVDQALKNRKGVVWLDEGRIPYKSNDKPSGGFGGMDSGIGKPGEHQQHRGCNQPNLRGRFPANLLVSGDALNDGKQHKTGNLFGSYEHGGGKIDYGKYGFSEHAHHADSGSFSRYFSLDAWFEKKLKELPEGVQKTFPFLIVPKASKAEKNGGCEELYWEKDNSSFGYHQVDRQRWIWLGKEEKRIYKEADKKVSLRTRGNIHPTVKPLKLFCYLITLGSHEGDVILDPFIGSGTTAVAAKMLARHYVGWETGLENVKIAKARLSILEPLLI